MQVHKSVTFAGTATARAQTTLVSAPIMRPCEVQEITARFPAGAANRLSLEFWVSPDNEAPTSGDPTGDNLLADYGQSHAIRGDAVQVTLRHSVPVPAAPVYLKVVATNTDYYDHAIDVDIQIGIEATRS